MRWAKHFHIPVFLATSNMYLAWYNCIVSADWMTYLRNPSREASIQTDSPLIPWVTLSQDVLLETDFSHQKYHISLKLRLAWTMVGVLNLPREIGFYNSGSVESPKGGILYTNLHMYLGKGWLQVWDEFLRTPNKPLHIEVLCECRCSQNMKVQ